MSQVKKLSNGDKISRMDDGGKYAIIWDGQTVNLTDDQLNQINNDIALLDPKLRMYLGNVSNSIKSGDFKGNRPENKMSTSAYSGLNKKALDALREGKRSRWEAITGSDTYYAKEAAAAALNIINNAINTKQVDTRTKLRSDEVPLDYNTNAEGKRYLSPINYKAENRVKQILEHLKAGDSSKYNADDWDLSNVSSWINSLDGDDKYKAAQDYFTDLWAKMRTPGFDSDVNYNAQDVEDVLNMFKIRSGGDSSASASPKTETQKQLESDFVGNENLYDIIGENFQKGKDGVWRLKPGVTFNLGIEGLDLAPGQGIYFNDDFYNSAYGTDPRYSALKGLTYYGGALYRLDDPTLQKILNVEGGYNERMRRGNWTGADSIIMTRFSNGARNNPDSLATDRYSTFLSDPSKELRYIDQTGAVKVNGMDPDDQIIQYVDLADESSFTKGNPYRRYKYKWALLDKRGDFKRNLDSSEIEPINNGAARDTGLLTYKRINDRNNKDYNGRYYEDILGSDEKPSGFRIYYNPNDPTGDVILHMPRINAINSENRDLKLPKELAQVLMQADPQWIDNIVGSSQAQSDFIEVMSHLVQKSFARGDANELVGTIFGMNDRQKLRRILKDDTEVEAFLRALYSAIKGKRAEERRGLYLTTSPRLQRLGGILKQQDGGFAGGTTKSTGVTERHANTETKNFRNAAGISEIGSDNWTQYDSLDLAALIGDLGSLTAAFVPGANVASAGIGAASSSARFAANKGRGTKGAGWNYALDLAMDAATLLPLLGAGAKGAKVVKAVKSALPIIIKAASVYGLGSAVVNSATKIANGEKWTPKDLSMVVNALTAATGLSRQGGFGKKTVKTSEVQPVTLKSKVEGGAELKLNSKQLEKIKNPDELFDALFAEAKKTNSTLTKEQFAEQYDISDLLETTKRWKPSWNPKTWFKKKEIKKFNPEVVDKNKNVEAKEGSFKEWWHGVGWKQQAYNQQLMGETPTRTTTKAYELKRTDTDVYPTRNPRKYRTKGTVSSREIPMSEFKERSVSSEIVPGGFTMLGQGPGHVQNPGVANYLAYTSRTSTTPVSLRGVALPQWIIPFTRANYQGYEYEQPSGLVYQPEYKQGGKILKGRGGLPGIAGLVTDQFSDEDAQKILDGIGTKDSEESDTIDIHNLFGWIGEQAKAAYNKASSTWNNWNNESDDISTLSFHDGKWKPRATTAKEDLGGGFNYNLPDYTKYGKSLIDGLRYYSTSQAQKSDRDLEKKKDRASIHSIYAHQFSDPNQNHPIFARRLNKIKRAKSDVNLGPLLSSNQNSNISAWLSRQAQLDKAENDLYNQESQFESQLKDKVIQAKDATYNAMADAKTAMSEQEAKANMAGVTADQMYGIRQSTSRDNALRDIENDIVNDRKIQLKYLETKYNSDLNDKFESDLRSKYNTAAAEYEKLSPTERAKYTGLRDYIIQTVPGASKWIDERDKRDTLAMLDWKRKNELNYNPGVLGGKQSSVGFTAKGGKIKGTTRYNRDPREQIWIDSNKAAHNQIAKLSDQTIKILLGSLK